MTVDQEAEVPSEFLSWDGALRGRSFSPFANQPPPSQQERPESARLIADGDAADADAGSASSADAARLSSIPRPAAIAAALVVAALVAGPIGAVLVVAVHGPVADSLHFGRESVPPSEPTKGQPRMGCANWQDVALMPAFPTDSQEACDSMCRSTAGCFHSDFQPYECYEDEHAFAGACFLFGPGCKKRYNPCWDLNVAPGPPGSRLEGFRTGCSNWHEIAIQPEKNVANVFHCLVECNRVNCSMYNFAPESGLCHVFRDGCTEVEHADYDLYSALRGLSAWTYVSDYADGPEHSLKVTSIDGFAKTTGFNVVYPDMSIKRAEVVDARPENGTILFSPPLQRAAVEGTMLYAHHVRLTGSTRAIHVGETVLPVADSAGFYVGDTIKIEGGGHEEMRTIVGFGSIIVDRPLEYEYPTSSLIAIQTTGAPTAAPTLPSTNAPTLAPTAVATPATTGAPTASPTLLPTNAPTTPPTAVATPARSSINLRSTGVTASTAARSAATPPMTAGTPQMVTASTPATASILATAAPTSATTPAPTLATAAPTSAATPAPTLATAAATSTATAACHVGRPCPVEAANVAQQCAQHGVHNAHCCVCQGISASPALASLCPAFYPVCATAGGNIGDCVISACSTSGSCTRRIAPSPTTDPASGTPSYNYISGYDGNGNACTGDFQAPQPSR